MSSAEVLQEERAHLNLTFAVGVEALGVRLDVPLLPGMVVREKKKS